MSILVTGANGGLGKCFFPLIQAHYQGQEIFKTVRSADGEFSCDLTISSEVDELVNRVKPKLIFHLAASFSGDFLVDFQCNVLALKNICDALIKNGLNSKIIVFGSAAEYGVVNPEDNPISESHALKPVSVYGLTKAMQTELALYYSRTTSLQLVVARIFNLAIPGLSTRLFFGRAESLINQFIQGKISSLEFGNLDSERDYVDISNAAKQIFAIANNGVSGEVYNVGTGVPQTMRSILEQLLKNRGISQDLIKQVSSEDVGRTGFDVPVIYANINKVLSLVTKS